MADSCWAFVRMFTGLESLKSARSSGRIRQIQPRKARQRSLVETDQLTFSKSGEAGHTHSENAMAGKHASEHQGPTTHHFRLTLRAVATPHRRYRRLDSSRTKDSDCRAQVFVPGGGSLAHTMLAEVHQTWEADIISCRESGANLRSPMHARK
jgi:hypothetical protein